MSKTHPADHVLAYKGRTDAVMRFGFEGKKWSLFTFVLAFAVGGGLYVVAEKTPYPGLMSLGAAVVFVLCLFASIWNFFSRRLLICDAGSKTLTDDRVSLVGKSKQRIPFSDIRGLRIYRNPTGRAGRSALVRIALETVNGDYAILGTTHVGTPTLSGARELADELSRLLNVPVNEEPSATRKR